MSLVLLVLLACGSNEASELPQRIPLIPLSTATEAEAALGQRVSLTGTTANTELGGAVQARDLEVYCMGHDPIHPLRWTEAVLGKTVRAEGVLERRPVLEAPASQEGADAEGQVLVLTQCRHEVVGEQASGAQ